MKIFLVVSSLFLVILSSWSGQCQDEELSYSFDASYKFSNSPDVFEGDIIKDQRNFGTVRSEDGIDIKTRLAIDNDKNLWPNKEIFYFNTFKNDPKMSKVIQEAINDIQSKTCLRFREITNEKQAQNYVYLYSGPGKGCLSNVGMIGGRQETSLEQPSCNTKNVIVHELLHAAGLWHMHSRPDRDKYINVYLENVQPNLRYAFDIQKGRYDPNFFDYNSIMLYFGNAFSSNGKDTMTKKNGERLVEDWDKNGMSPGDVAEIKGLYKC